jgi:hypothetical protein
MGLLITDVITLDSGLQVTNAYASIGTQTIRISKSVGETAHDPPHLYQYLAEAKIDVWVNQEKATEKDTSHVLKSYNVLVNKEGGEPFTENVYKLLYTQFKNTYGFTCVDVLE